MGNPTNRNPGPICEYIKAILIKTTKNVGLLEEYAKKAVFVLFNGNTADGTAAPPREAGYSRIVDLSASPKEGAAVQLGFSLDAGHPAYYLLCNTVDVLSAWLGKAALEEGLDSLMRGDFRFSSMTGQPMDEDEAAFNVFSQMNQLVISVLQELLNFPVSLLESLSLERYEGDPVSGDLVIAFSDKVDQIRKSSILWTPEGLEENTDIHLNEESLRHVVKLMAGCEEDPVLFEIGTDGAPPRFAGCIGGNRLDKWEAAGSDIIRIRIEGQLKWTFYLRGRLLFRSSFHGFQADLREEEERLNRQLLQSALKREFPSLKADSIERLVASLRELQRQRHGTAALIIKEKSCTWWHICDLAKQKKATHVRFVGDAQKTGAKGNPLMAAARMDGAVVLNTEGRVCFLMTILDGMSCIAGDLSRGARYNSVRNFVCLYSEVEGRPEEILGVVFSSDGNMDILSGKELIKEKINSPEKDNPNGISATAPEYGFSCV